MTSPPIRFATGAGRVDSRAGLVAKARRAEDLGYSTLCLPDHFMVPLAPLIALQAVADSTSTLRVGQAVLANGFRHPAVLAKELATLDMLSDGRLEIGLGAGWMGAEFEQAGIPFPTAGIRIQQLDECVSVLKGLFGDGRFHFSGRHFTINGLEGTPKPLQRPHPPIMIGGGGRKVLSLAGRQADIVQILPGSIRGGGGLSASDLTQAAFEEKVGWVRDAAGARFAELEIAALLMKVVVTDDVATAEDAFLAGLDAEAGTDPPPPEELLASPLVAIGSLGQVCDKLVESRDRFGLSSLTIPMGTRPETLGPVIERLARN